ncbi:Hypothetical_protein [Hexamita inflata]|uniref:Hypothetical_protein n=1 Tax=Hexamita inflata TaxID=28002 RepID=A0AA86QUF8_9EUKA|nr:Hypothetical protein HINF_LOCUS47483 [Hexamita inflata]
MKQNTIKTIFTDVLKLTLTIIQEENIVNKTNKELCYIIDNIQNQRDFWYVVKDQINQYLGANTQTTVYSLMTHYKTYYKQVLFTDKLNQADCQYLEQYIVKNSDYADFKISNMAKELMETYFNKRDIFIYEVSRKLYQLKGKQLKYQGIEQQDHLINDNKYVLEQQNKLQDIIQDLDKKSQNSEEIRARQQLLLICQNQEKENQNQSIKQSQLSSQLLDTQNTQIDEVQNTESQTQLFSANNIMGIPLSAQDKTYIQNFMQKHSQKIKINNLTALQITDELVNAYFKEANIFISVIEEFVDQLLAEQNKVYNNQINNQINIQQSDAKEKIILKRKPIKQSSLKLKYSNATSKNLVNQQLLKSLCYVLNTELFLTKYRMVSRINLLTKAQTDSFWSYFHSIQSDGSVLEWQDFFFNNFIETEKYSLGLNLFTIEDTNLISQYVQNNPTLGQAQISLNLFNQYFKNRNFDLHIIMNKVSFELVTKNHIQNDLDAF